MSNGPTPTLDREGRSGLAIVFPGGDRAIVTAEGIHTFMGGTGDWSGIRGTWSEASLHREKDALVVRIVDVTDHEGATERITARLFRSVDGGRTWRDEPTTGEPSREPPIATLSTALDALPVVGRLRLVRRLGEGALGEVHEALDDSGAVAARFLRGHEDDGVRTAAAELAEKLPRIRHRNLVPVHTIETLPDGRILVVADLAQHSLADVVAKAAVSATRACEIAHAMLSGLEALHAAGVVHGTVSPSAVFYAGDPRFMSRPPALADAGLGIVVGRAAPSTKSGPWRTQLHLSPEAYRRAELDVRTDVYGVGLCLYEMLAGEHPFAFAASSPLELALAILQKEPPPLPSSTRAPEALVAIVERAMAKDPARRFQSAREMREALQSAAVEV